jgi:creatinine amidohydrolase
MDRLVDQPSANLPVYDLWPYDQSRIPSTGILNTARGATAEGGSLFVAEFTSTLSDALREAFGR